MLMAVSVYGGGDGVYVLGTDRIMGSWEEVGKTITLY